ncbi:hypothetical protein [Halostagnicola sp. A-GB9-2]|uniref:hypothetical protein n=1 Tax=Halostagnicola sp. A-GB9-2 TaxID=3048066 RepID=UPI0024BF3514|nr:hypothetical protein [Halostagnicola sp. A-GB9-2]MDJ1434576.1 hypothetical protein [Halostagnicola sp. A-GB9-2]
MTSHQALEDTTPSSCEVDVDDAWNFVADVSDNRVRCRVEINVEGLRESSSIAASLEPQDCYPVTGGVRAIDHSMTVVVEAQR